jgi:tetratricopeptide (TPR) repeat protein
MARIQTGVVRSGLMGRLSMKSHEELLALLEQLMQRQPDIESLIELLIELPLVTTAPEEKLPGTGRKRTVDPSTIHSQVASAFYDAGDGWEAAGRAASELDRLCEIGHSFAGAGQWANAQVVYATVAQQTIHYYERLQDEGQLAGVIDDCIAGLIACLEAQSHLPQKEQLDDVEREELLATLFDLWKSGHSYGLAETDIPDVMAHNVTEQERTMVEQWVRQEMRQGQDYASKWQNRRVIDFLAALNEAVQFSDEDLLEEYRKAGLYPELTSYLLQLGREEEALEVAKETLTEPGEVTRFAEQLLSTSETWRSETLALVETRLKEAIQALGGKSQDFTGTRTVDTYRRWLGERYRQYGEIGLALDMERARFQANPDETTYRSVRSVAQLPEQPERWWSDLQPRLIQTLEQQNRWAALVSIYLDEGEVGQALAALARMEQQPGSSLYGYGYHSAPSHYQIQVAKAAEEHYPNEAIRLYKGAIQKLIDGRGRENYQQAVDHLTHVKQLYQKQGRESEWQAYVKNLRNSNKSLRALKEELDKKGM